jgi:hypothetical protein
MMIKGTIQITGVSGVGKTTFAVESGVPFERIAFLSWDVKTPPYESLLGAYRNFNADILPFVAGNKVDPHMKAVANAIDFINSLKQGQYDVIILDAWESFQKALSLYVSKHMHQFRREFHASSGRIRIAEEKGYGAVVEAGLFAYLQSVANTVFVVNHVKQKWENNVRTDKLLPVNSTAVIQKTVARFWLVETDGHPCPSALVVKNHASYKYIKGKGVRTLKMFPDKISPKSLPGYEDMEYVSLWDVISHYIENPVGTRDLGQHESLSSSERRLISDAIVTSFTEDDAEENRKEAAESGMMGDAALVKRVKESSKSSVMLMKELKPEYPEVTIAIIKKIRDS